MLAAMYANNKYRGPRKAARIQSKYDKIIIYYLSSENSEAAVTDLFAAQVGLGYCGFVKVLVRTYVSHGLVAMFCSCKENLIFLFADERKSLSALKK